MLNMGVFGFIEQFRPKILSLTIDVVLGWFFGLASGLLFFLEQKSEFT
jgi:hypothetical protein